jgi:hypothetical protein
VVIGLQMETSYSEATGKLKILSDTAECYNNNSEIFRPLSKLNQH